MAAKLGIAEEEADESQYWIELLVEAGELSAQDAKPLHKEINEIVSILVASRRTLRNRIKGEGSVIRETRKEYLEPARARSPKRSRIGQSSNLAFKQSSNKKPKQ